MDINVIKVKTLNPSQRKLNEWLVCLCMVFVLVWAFSMLQCDFLISKFIKLNTKHDWSSQSKVDCGSSGRCLFQSDLWDKQPWFSSHEYSMCDGFLTNNQCILTTLEVNVSVRTKTDPTPLHIADHIDSFVLMSSETVLGTSDLLLSDISTGPSVARTSFPQDYFQCFAKH